MKRSVLFFICFLVSVSFTNCLQEVAKAQVTEEQLDQYLTNLNWTTGELVEYLEFLDYSIEDFDSLEELKSFLGTPITNENLQNLFGKYNLTHHDLEVLLAEYGESLDDFKFIEDLDFHIEFFLNYQEEFSIVNDFLSLFGLTENEMENLFEYISHVEINVQKLESIFRSLEALSYLQGVDELSNEEKAEVFSLWNQLLETLKIDGRYYLVENEEMTSIKLETLLTEEALEDFRLFIALHNADGEVLATLSFSEDMVHSHLIFESLEQLAEISKIATDYRNMYTVAKLPITAGHFVTNILVSIFFIIAGFFMLFVAKRRVIV
ncbi:processed acidic surface protein [Anaerobacillus isosaccharinicus]|uniref:Processed acidic surface protein n=1 Tax=Anaerobacillus isosaccharinicus TaxID=1532552 RepID=A0A1S2M3P8_9BACI|nr:processed acidic surface protein [Anaerobacillus isosaccharinicus]MBA5585273.1 processed acidic surface protein [Anaerobacillus isosaccharinicus]QOY36396.1 processed acidic surface protein [Anaerobacillus isosaccharinicus]